MNSMTGFGRAEGMVGGSLVTVEVKSVNHRYLDTRFRTPSFLSPLEPALSEMIRDKFLRGSFEIGIRHRLLSSGTGAMVGTKFVVDEVAAQTYWDGCETLKRKFDLDSKATLEMFGATNRILVPVEETPDPESAFPEIKKIFGEALDALAVMRQSEGTKLKKILESGIDELESIRTKLIPLAGDQNGKIREKLVKRIEEWKITHPVDSDRLEWEVAFYADRADFTEELDRLAAHCEAFRAKLLEKKPTGRRLDFLTQELHRELNTMGSKTPIVEITRLVLDGKGQIEKLRQQVQNVE